MKPRKKLIVPAAALVLAAVVGMLFRSPSGRAHQLSGSLRHETHPRVAETGTTFATFSDWLAHAPPASGEGRSAWLARGVELARERRVAMESLIRTDPRHALEQAVTLDAWKNLPDAIRAEVEEPFSAMADFRVLPVCDDGAGHPAESNSDAVRWLGIKGEPSLQGFTFGRRESVTSKERSPVQGIRLGGIAALDEGVFNTLDAAEAALAELAYPLANPQADRDFSTGEAIGNSPVVALSGGKIFKFASAENLSSFSHKIALLDETPGPHGGAALMFLPFPANDGGFDIGQAELENQHLASSWTENKKKLLMIRCDFPDRPDSISPVVANGTYGTLLNTTVSNTFRDESYGKTWIEADVSTSVIRLPKIATYYAVDDGTGSSRNDELLAAAKTAYATANPGFVASNYDIIGVWFVNIGMTSGGVQYSGLGGGTNLWIQGSTDTALHVHELGHCYGLGHASSWEPPAGSSDPVSATGTSTEYGDPFDIMGTGPLPQGSFHAEAKQRLNWLGEGTWADNPTTGTATYRLYRIDHPATTGIRGVRITRAADDYLWLSYRRSFANQWLQSGANVVWKRATFNHSWLIDTTPGSLAEPADKTDGSIAIGTTWASGNVFITPLSRGGTAPNEYLEVRVNTGTFSGNVAPKVTLAGPATIAARQTTLFTAAATDADGDPLAYAWDFGDGFTFDNRAEAIHSWTVGGTYVVKVTVSDMKGHSVVATTTVTVTDPLTLWTDRIADMQGDFTAIAASPTMAIAVAAHNYAYSVTGEIWTPSQFGANCYFKTAVWDGTQFLAAGYEIVFSPSFQTLGAIYSSTTGASGTWLKRFQAGPSINQITYGNGIYIAVGMNGTILRSTDASNWTTVASGTTNTLESVAYGNGTFVIVGRQPDANGTPGTGNAVVLTSTNGSNWTNTSVGAGLQSWQDLRSVVWAGNRFLASGSYSKLRQSTDSGATFTTTREGTEDTRAIAYGNGIWFASGVNRDQANADTDLISINGSTWIPAATPPLDDRNAAAYFNSTFVTVGNNHTIRQSGIILPSASGYTTWRDLYLPDHGADSTDQADADKDGLANVLEYGLGLSPASGGHSHPLPQAVAVDPDPLLSDRISLRINLPSPVPGDLIYTVEVASSLTGAWSTLATKTGVGDWVWNGGGTSRIVVGTPVSGRVIVKVGDSQPLGAQKSRFLRLRTKLNL